MMLGVPFLRPPVFGEPLGLAFYFILVFPGGRALNSYPAPTRKSKTHWSAQNTPLAQPGPKTAPLPSLPLPRDLQLDRLVARTRVQDGVPAEANLGEGFKCYTHSGAL